MQTFITLKFKLKRYRLYYLFFISLLISYSKGNGQNLIPNPSFETIGICPAKHGESAGKFDSYTNSWYSANVGSPDLFTDCSEKASVTPLNIIPPNVFPGIQTARTGSVYAGLIHYGLAEYLGNTLKEPLEAGKNYEVSFYVSCAGKQIHITDAIGMYISSEQIKIRTGTSNPAITNVIPQIISSSGNFIQSTSWTKISGYYTAKGGEQYITVGSFFNEKTNNVISSHIQVLPAAVDPTIPASQGGPQASNRLYYFYDDFSMIKTITGPLAVCKNSVNTYSINPIEGATSYAWEYPSDWTGSSTSESISLTAGQTSGRIKVTANDPANTVQEIEVKIDMVAPSQPGIIKGDEVLCGAKSTTYSIDPVVEATSYVWTLPDGWTGATPLNSISITSDGSSGSITVAATNSCGTSDIQSFDIEGASKPSQPDVISGPLQVCAEQTATYQIESVENATTYTWALPTGWSGTSLSESISVTANDLNGTIKVMATNGCGSSAQRILDVTSVASVPDAPDPISGMTEICRGTEQIYHVNSINDATYIWTLPSYWKGSSSSESITVVPDNSSGTISITAQNACGNSAEQALTITVNDKPEKPELMSGAATICAGYESEYRIDEVNGADAYTWTLPAEWHGTSNTNVISVIPDKNSGKLIVNANNKCGISEEESFNITVIDVPAIPSSIIGPEEICAGAENTFSIANVTSADTYQWTLPENWKGTSISESISVKASGNSGTIKVVVKNNCGTSAEQSYDVTLKTILVPVTIQNDILYTNQAQEYLWFDCEHSNEVLSTDNSFSPAKSGNYAVTLKSDEGCINTSSCIFVSVLGLSKPSDTRTFSVFPNPADENITVDFTNLQADKVSVSVLDYQGKEYYSKEIYSAGNGLHAISLTEMSSGTYLIKVIYKDNVSVEKITVIK